MAKGETLAIQGGRGSAGVSQLGWYGLCAVLVILGLLLAARAGDDYMAASGMLFAAFGIFLGFRLLRRAVP